MRKQPAYDRGPGTARPPCLNNPDLFFAEAPSDIRTAQRLCLGCQIRSSCYEGARERREPCGVWGGVLFRDGTPRTRITARTASRA